MATEQTNKGTIFCTKEQFDTLMSTGSVTIDGTTYTYEDGFIYAVVDKDYVDLTSDQGIEGTKTFIDEANNKSIGINGSGFIKDGTYSINLPNKNGTLVAGMYKHCIRLTDASDTFISLIAYSTSSTPVSSNSTLQEILQVGVNYEYYTGILAGNDAPRPCAIELSYGSDAIGVRYGLDGQSMITFSISTYNDIVTAI